VISASNPKSLASSASVVVGAAVATADGVEAAGSVTTRARKPIETSSTAINTTVTPITALRAVVLKGRNFRDTPECRGSGLSFYTPRATKTHQSS